jgi:poly(ADP-ribose) glycohydrolase
MLAQRPLSWADFLKSLKAFSGSSIKSLGDGHKKLEKTRFFNNLLPKIVIRAIAIPRMVDNSIPLLKRGMNHSITMSQEQVACLLANAFLCTFQKQKNVQRGKDYGEINFAPFLSAIGHQIQEKFLCIENYFNRVYGVSPPKGVITFQRVGIANLPELEGSNVKLSGIQVSLSTETVHERGKGCLRMIYTTEVFGERVLQAECSENEIPFFLHPELIVSLLFCENLDDNEAIVVSGCEKFNEQVANAKKFRWKSDYIDTTPCDNFRRRLTNFVITKANFDEKYHQQFYPEIVLRDFRRTYAGLFCHQEGRSTIPVIARRWPPDRIKRSKHLTFLILLLACNFSQRNLIFCTEKEVKFRAEIHSLFNYFDMHNITAGMIYEAIKEFNVYANERVISKKLHPHKELFQFINKWHFDNVIRPALEETFGIREPKFTQIGDTLAVIQNTSPSTSNAPKYVIKVMSRL